MKVGICTLGCKVNTYESEYLEQELKKRGYEIAPVDEICDVYIINTCTVTNQADVKSRKMIHRFRKNNPDACIVAMGCFIEILIQLLILQLVTKEKVNWLIY